MFKEYLTGPKKELESPIKVQKNGVRAWLIWLTLFLIYPLGLILMWVFSGWKNKKKILLTFLIPIFIIIIYYLIYFALIFVTSKTWENKSQTRERETKEMLSGGKQKNNPENTTTEILENFKYQYSFNYPKELHLGLGTSQEMVKFSIYGDAYYIDIDIQSYKFEEINIKPETKLENIIYLNEKELDKNYHKISEEEILIGGVKALKISRIDVEGDEAFWRISTYLTNNNIFYSFNYYEHPSLFKQQTTLEEKVNNPPDTAIYDIILSTFKFLR